ncbi:MAG TPA: Wzz/FepE/Etk N-terminal domain-containing protein [Actinomycetes bacterium]|nr:Wzz/FepE/Etk N-terminal domain-containing protein [Actinomycetes bacterium]
MEHSATGGTASLGEFADAMRRRWWMLMLGAVIGLAFASVYLLIAPKTFISTATVYVNSVGATADTTIDNARLNSDINLDTEAQLVKSQVVSSIAKTRLETPEIVGQLVQHVTVTVPPNTNVLRISFSSSTAEQARLGAAAYASAYLQNRRTTTDDVNNAQTRALEQQVALKQAELRQAKQSPGNQDQQDIILGEITAINARLSSLVGTTVNPGYVMNEPLAARQPSSPNQMLVLFSGFALGILIGLLGVAWLERRDGRVYDWRILERRLRLPVLTNVPGSRDEIPALLPAHSPGGQAYTELRNVLLSGVTSSGGIIVIAEPEPGSGADAVAVNLAASFARADYTTTLLVADVTSSAPALAGLPHGPGLAEALKGKASLAEVSRSVTGVDGLSVIAPGLKLDEEIDDLEGAGIGAALRTLRERSRIVIVRAPATVAGADAQLLARLSDVAVPVVEIGRTHRDLVTVAVRQWSIVGITVPGVVTVPALGLGPDPILVGPKKSERPAEKLTRAPVSR